MRNIFRKKAKVSGGVAFYSCEDPNTIYIELPDGLRLIFREGEYVGHYIP